MRNPLTVALAAMALHSAGSLAFGWPYPSVGTFVAGLLAVLGAVVAANAPPRATSGMVALAVLSPPLAPAPILAAGIAAVLSTRLPHRPNPLRNAAIALPSLAFLILGMTI